LLLLYVHLSTLATAAGRHVATGLARRHRSEAGQTSAEYALVLLGAAGVALLVAAWAKKSDRVGGLLDTVFDGVVDMVK
jgi:Flp pilus assembly pilin Flp